MRPIYLKMCGFGPYAGEQEIDFTVLGQAGIYLITGDTGAGKTTIFDGITFALFGSASGEDRESNMFRSKYALEDTKTYVEFIFEYREAQYKIERNPEYIRPRKKGEGYTKENPNATLWMPDGSIVSGVNQVKEKVNEILGVSYEQFTKIVMIAQGAFKKFLFADTAQRREILSNIFGTELYNVFQDKLNSESMFLARECRDIRNSLNQYLTGTVCGEESIYANQWEQVCANKLRVDESMEIIEKIIREDEKTESDATERINQIDAQINAINSELGYAKQIEKIEKQKQSDEEKLPLLRKDEEEKKSKKDSAIKKTAELEEVQQIITIKEQEMIKYDELENKKKQLSENIQQSTLKSDLINQLKTKLEEYSMADSEYTKEHDELVNAGENLAVFNSNLDKINKSIEEYDSLKLKLSDYYNSLNDKEKAQTDYMVSMKKYEEINDEYMKKYKLFLNEQAGILAENLKENEPCPVCGSTNHPLIAGITPGAPSQTELENLKLHVDMLHNQMMSKNAVASSLVSALAVKSSQITEDARRCLNVCKIEGDNKLEDINNDLTEAVNNAHIEKKKLMESIDAEKKNITRKEKLEHLITKNKDALENAKNSISDIHSEVARIDGIIDESKKQIEELTITLSFASKKEATEFLNTKIKEKEYLSNYIENAKKEYDTAKKKLDDMTATLKTYEEQLKGAKKVDVTMCETRLAELSENKKVFTVKRDKALERLSRNKIAYDSVNNGKGELLLKEEKYEMISQLADTACGKLTGKQKIKLETYVQMSYFDKIINKANIRMLKMTSGQYELKRREDNKEGNTQVGLDLDVIDHYNGSLRSVKSLSGGESFKASLALALG